MKRNISIIAVFLLLITALGCSGVHYGTSGWFCYWSADNGGLGTYPACLAMDDEDNCYIGGVFYGTADLNPGSGVDLHTARGSGADAFLVKVSSDGSYQWGKSWGGDGILDDNCQSVAIDRNGNIYVTGYFVGPCDMDPGAGTDIQAPDYP